MFKSARVFLYLNVCLLLFLLIKGFFLYQALSGYSFDQYTDLYDKKVVLEGFICEEAEVDWRLRRLVICAPEKILIFSSLYPEYNYGDYLKVSGKLQEAPSFPDFDYKLYLRSRGVGALMSFAKVEKVEREVSLKQKLYLKLLKFKWGIQRIINKSLLEPEASLANALILGYKKALYEEESEAFSRAGLSHLIVISGTHVSILAALIMAFAFFIGFSRKIAIRLVLIFLMLYPFLVGLSPSAIRASLMGGLMFIAYFYGRLSRSLNALLFSANLLLLFNPLLVYLDVGFQLSFTAVLGIIYIYPLFGFLKKYLSKKETKYNKYLLLFFDIFTLTLACQIVLFPIIAYHFKTFSMLSFIANPFIAWILPPLIAFIIVGLIISSIVPVIYIIVFTPAYLLLKFFNAYAQFFSSFEKAIVGFNNFSGLSVFLYYLFLIIVVRYIYKRKRRKYRQGRRV